MNEIPTNNPEFFPDGLMENVVTEATTSTECVNNNKRTERKAPDKIYLDPGFSGDFDLATWDTEKKLESDVEYIRKDKILAVLETFSNPTTKLFVRSIIESLSKIN